MEETYKGYKTGISFCKSQISDWQSANFLERIVILFLVSIAFLATLILVLTGIIAEIVLPNILVTTMLVTVGFAASLVSIAIGIASCFTLFYARQFKKFFVLPKLYMLAIKEMVFSRMCRIFYAGVQMDRDEFKEVALESGGKATSIIDDKLVQWDMSTESEINLIPSSDDKTQQANVTEQRKKYPTFAKPQSDACMLDDSRYVAVEADSLEIAMALADMLVEIEYIDAQRLNEIAVQMTKSESLSSSLSTNDENSKHNKP